MAEEDTKQCPLCFGRGKRLSTDFTREGSSFDIIVTCWKCKGEGRVKKNKLR